jgi:hypothetical protein
MVRGLVFGWLFLFWSIPGMPGCQEQGPQNFRWPNHNIKARYDFKLPDAVDECSGAISWTDSTFLTHNDDGPAELYEVSYKGNLVRTIAIPGAENVDWEDVTCDTTGTLYISDLGNNRNMRKDLAIYVYTPGAKSARKIRVKYGDQYDFPPIEREKNFDSESIFWWEGALYAITKNRGHHLVKMYRISTQVSDQVVYPVDSMKLFEPITGAAVSPNKKVLAVLGYGKVYLFRLSKGKNFFAQPMDSIRFKYSGQSEAIWWRDQAHLYVGNEAQRVFCFERIRGVGF